MDCCKIQQKKSVFRENVQSSTQNKLSGSHSDYEDTDSTLKSSAGDYRIPCSYNCGKIIESKSLESHVKNECPMAMVDCDFKYVGCDVRLPRKDMPVHLEQAVIYHLSKRVARYEEHIKMLEADNKMLAARYEKLEVHHHKLEQKVSEMADKISMLVNTCDQSQEGIDQDFESVDEPQGDEDYSYVSAIRSVATSPVPNLLTNSTVSMLNFQLHKKNDDRWVSHPFYTHTQGYKMCLRVTANGQGSGKGTHITAAVCLMKGEFDEQLEWPFRGDITIQLLSQQGDVGHYERTIYQAKGERSKTSSGERVICGWGISQYKSLHDLSPKYLQNDSLRFHISTLVKSKPALDPQMIETEV